jgi:hypothetical protein
MKEYVNMEKAINVIIEKLNNLKKTAKRVCIKTTITKKGKKKSKRTKKNKSSNINFSASQNQSQNKIQVEPKNEYDPLTESFVNKNETKMNTTSNINKVYKAEQLPVKTNDVKQNLENYVIKNGIEQINNNIDNNLNNHKIEKLDEEGKPVIYPVHNLVSNRRRNNLFIRKI